MIEGLTLNEYERLVTWLKDANRKPASAAFTAGTLRDAAYAFEDAAPVIIATARQAAAQDAYERAAQLAEKCPNVYSLWAYARIAVAHGMKIASRIRARAAAEAGKEEDKSR